VPSVFRIHLAHQRRSSSGEGSRKGSRRVSLERERGGERALAGSRISGCFTERFTRPAGAVRVLCNAGSGSPLPDTPDYSRCTSGNYGQFSPRRPSAVLHITGVRPRNYARSGRVNVKICMKLLCTRLTFASNTSLSSLPPPDPDESRFSGRDMPHRDDIIARRRWRCSLMPRRT